MPRLPREYSYSKVYHIIIKGIDDGDIFYDNEDKQVFKEKMKLTKEKFKYKIYAYCLMNNHVHLVIEVANDTLSKAMQGLSVRYVHYFNRKYNRKGPLIQERFKSKKVEDMFIGIQKKQKLQKQMIIIGAAIMNIYLKKN